MLTDTAMQATVKLSNNQIIQEASQSSNQPVPERHLSNNQIIQEEDQNTLMMARDGLRYTYFLIGDIANKYLRMTADTGYKVPAARIFDAVAYFSGHASRTVRYYAETAAFYPEAVREEYGELPFSYFVTARYAGDKWRDVLDFAAANPNVTLGVLQAQYGAQPLCDLPARDVFADDGTLNPIDVVAPPVDKKNNTADGTAIGRQSQLLMAISDLVDKSEQLLWQTEADMLPTEIREGLLSVLTGFRELLPKLAAVMRKTIV
jgi:hypothetical protein